MKKQTILTVLGIGVIGLAVFSYFQFQGQLVGNTPEFGKLVIVAKATVPVGTVLDKGQLGNFFEQKNVPNNYVVNGAITDPNKLVGKKVVATLDVNQQVTDNLLDSHTIKLGADDRLFSFPIDWTRSVGADVFPNDVVDINVVNPKTGQTQSVIKSVAVYKVQDANGVEITREKMVQTQNGAAHVAPALITVAANPQMVEALQTAQTNGQLFLTKYTMENLPK